MSPRTTRLIGFVAFAALVVFVAVLPSFVNDFNANGEDRNVMLDKANFYRE